MREANNGAASQRKLAAKLGVEQPNISMYIRGEQTPDIHVIERLLKHMGSDIQRALPGYMETLSVQESPGVYEVRPKAAVLGQVQAGAFSPAGDSLDYLDLDLSMWGKRVHEMGLVEVVGDSMMPWYRPGQYLVCRCVHNGNDVPDGTPCIFEEHGNTTFKLLRRLKSGRMVAQPLNCEHELIEITGRNVRVQMVVVGSLDMGKGGK